MWSLIDTGFGFWDVYAWIAFFLLAGGGFFYLRSQGRKDYRRGTDQGEIFYGGNPVPEDGKEITVPASSAYWGFTRALEGWYEWLTAWHSGMATEYLGYMVLVMGLLALAVVR